jgi:hypothetical protein
MCIMLRVTLRFPWRRGVGSVSRDNAIGAPIRNATQQCSTTILRAQKCNQAVIDFQSNEIVDYRLLF